MSRSTCRAACRRSGDRSSGQFRGNALSFRPGSAYGAVFAAPERAFVVFVAVARSRKWARPGPSVGPRPRRSAARWPEPVPVLFAALFLDGLRLLHQLSNLVTQPRGHRRTGRGPPRVGCHGSHRFHSERSVHASHLTPLVSRRLRPVSKPGRSRARRGEGTTMLRDVSDKERSMSATAEATAIRRRHAGRLHHLPR